MVNLKNKLKRIPLIVWPAKQYYDRSRENKKTKQVKLFLENKELPFIKEAPAKYSIGHEPTIRCNLNCKMCYQANTRALRTEEMSTEEALAVYDKLKDRAKLVKLVGGEPMVRRDILDLLKYWNEAGQKITLQTNCTLINESNIEELAKMKNIVDIATSLDGPKEVHDMVRGVPGTYDRLERSIALIKEKMPWVTISVFATLLINDNLNDLRKLVDTCKGLGIGSIQVLFEQVYQPEVIENSRRIFQTVFGWQEGDYRLNTQPREKLWSNEIKATELRKILNDIRKYGARAGCTVNFVPFNFLDNLEEYLGEKPVRPLCMKLLNPELRISQKGEVVWCDVIEKSFGSLLEKSPDEIWLSSEYQQFREFLYKNSLPICQRCCKATYVK